MIQPKYSYEKGYEYFVSSENGMEYFQTEEERDVYLKTEVLPSYEDSDGTWYSEVSDIIAGVITHITKECNRQVPIGSLDEDGYDEDGEWWEDQESYRCDFELQKI